MRREEEWSTFLIRRESILTIGGKSIWEIKYRATKLNSDKLSPKRNSGRVAESRADNVDQHDTNIIRIRRNRKWVSKLSTNHLSTKLTIILQRNILRTNPLMLRVSSAFQFILFISFWLWDFVVYIVVDFSNYSFPFYWSIRSTMTSNTLHHELAENWVLSSSYSMCSLWNESVEKYNHSFIS